MSGVFIKPYTWFSCFRVRLPSNLDRVFYFCLQSVARRTYLLFCDPMQVDPADLELSRVPNGWSAMRGEAAPHALAGDRCS